MSEIPTSTNINLARCTRRHIAAVGASLATGHLDIRPRPVGAATLAAQNINISSAALDSASHPFEGEVGDGNASSRSASRATILVVLLNDNALLPN